MAGKSPLPSSPTRDRVVVSHDQEIAQPGPESINITIDKESGQSDSSDSTASQHEPHNDGPPSDASPLELSSKEAPCRCPPWPPDTMNIRNVLHGNAGIIFRIRQ
jgi:hypothetical protein